ncbi:MAG: class I SAM-dependent methyltransferase [Bacteroidota bacterium]
MSIITYGKNWDRYYQRTYRESNGKALWDVPADRAAERDLEVFEKELPTTLPIIDLGCGTGVQTVFLAQHYPAVLGVDASEEAIQIAREAYGGDSHQFGILDATDPKAAQAIHQELGDAHIYSRGVLHQLLKNDYEALIQTLRTLLGQKGRLYCMEVSDQIRAHFDASADDFSQLPERMRQVFLSDLPPRGLSLEGLSSFFPEDQFRILQSGPGRLLTNLNFSDGSPIYIPAVYAIIEAISKPPIYA